MSSTGSASRKSRNDSPAPKAKPAAAKPVAAPQAKKEEDVQEGNICGFHPQGTLSPPSEMADFRPELLKAVAAEDKAAFVAVSDVYTHAAEYFSCMAANVKAQLVAAFDQGVRQTQWAVLVIFLRLLLPFIGLDWVNIVSFSQFVIGAVVNSLWTVMSLVQFVIGAVVNSLWTVMSLVKIPKFVIGNVFVFIQLYHSFPCGRFWDYRYMCDDYKRKPAIERCLFCVGCLGTLFSKPTEIWQMDVINNMLQGALIIENEKKLQQAVMMRGNNWLAICIMILSFSEVAWRLNMIVMLGSKIFMCCFTILMLVIGTMLPRIIDERYFKIFQRVFILLSISLKLLQ